MHINEQNHNYVPNLILKILEFISNPNGTFCFHSHKINHIINIIKCFIKINKNIKI